MNNVIEREGTTSYNYNKITDSLMFLGCSDNPAMLKINVNLYQNSNKYGRKFFYKEIEYLSSKNGWERKIDRTLDVYMSIENARTNTGSKDYVWLFGGDLEMMKIAIVPELIKMVYYDFDKIYEKRGDKFYVNGDGITFDTIGSKSLTFAPGLHSNPYRDEIEACVDMYMNCTNQNPTNVIHLTISQVWNLIHIINTINLQTYGAMMVDSISKHIPLGYNLIKMR